MSRSLCPIFSSCPSTSSSCLPILTPLPHPVFSTPLAHCHTHTPCSLIIPRSLTFMQHIFFSRGLSLDPPNQPSLRYYVQCTDRKTEPHKPEPSPGCLYLPFLQPILFLLLLLHLSLPPTFQGDWQVASSLFTMGQTGSPYSTPLQFILPPPLSYCWSLCPPSSPMGPRRLQMVISFPSGSLKMRICADIHMIILSTENGAWL